jgi:acyl dehydratase
MNEMQSVITDEVADLIGAKSRITAWDRVERSEVRRFAQAIMDPDPIYFDDEAAHDRGLPGVVAPPLFPLYAFRFPPTHEDALARAAVQTDFHGGAFLPRLGLPDIPVPQKGLLNGGNDIEFLRHAAVGDRLTAECELTDIYEKSGRSGHLVFIEMDMTFRNQDGDVLLRNKQIEIRR